ncbi:MAG: hypothetical protein ACKVVP_15280 [Chloroflexota bacterium]
MPFNISKVFIAVFMNVVVMLASMTTMTVDGQELSSPIEGIAFIDLDGDGIREENEPLAAGIIIRPISDSFTGRTPRGSLGRFSVQFIRTPGSYPVSFSSDLLFDGQWRAPLEAVRPVPLDAEVPPLTVGLVRAASIRDERYFERTGFRVEHGYIWDYYLRRGGESVFGAPVSGLFSVSWVMNGNCCWMQLFERGALQVIPSVNIAGRLVESVNLFDVPHGFPALVGADAAHGLYPPIDPTLRDLAPDSAALSFPLAFDDYLDRIVPDEWDGLPVGFRRLYLEAATAVAAGEGPGIRSLVALELWGYPLSRPAPDPERPGIVYQRFQHAIMRYRVDCDCTERMALGTLLRDVLRDRDLDPTFRELQLRTLHPIVGIFRADLLRQEMIDVNRAVSILAMEP